LGDGGIDTIFRYCACSRRPLASPSFSISIFALHQAHCPLYDAGKHTVGVAAKYTFCNRLLGLSVSVMMTLTRGAGAISLSPMIQFHEVVEDSPAFALTVEIIHSFDQENLSEVIDRTRDGLLKLFHEKKAAPTDRLADGSTILHVGGASTQVRHLVQTYVLVSPLLFDKIKRLKLMIND
jgi:hypothetical protein